MALGIEEQEYRGPIVGLHLYIYHLIVYTCFLNCIFTLMEVLILSTRWCGFILIWIMKML